MKCYLSGERFELVEVLDVQAEDVNVGVLYGNLIQIFCLLEDYTNSSDHKVIAECTKSNGKQDTGIRVLG